MLWVAAPSPPSLHGRTRGATKIGGLEGAPGLGAGYHDGFLCETTAFTPDCFVTALFEPRSNVVAQVDVGFGSTSLELDYRLDDFSVFRAGAGDVDGVGHFRAKTNTGLVQLNMLTTECRGAECCQGYADSCR